MSSILLITFVIGIIQIIPFATIANTHQDVEHAQDADVAAPDDVSILEVLDIKDPIGTHVVALDPPVYDYVDSHYYDGYGSTTSFANMQSSSTSYATLTEAASSTTTIDYENYWYPWMSEDYSATEWCEVEVNGEKKFVFSEDGGQGSSTSNYAQMPDTLLGNSGGILSPSYDLSSADYFVYSVYIKDYGLANADELKVYFRDSSGNYDYKFYWDQCGPAVDYWRYYELTVEDPQYLYNGFRIRYESKEINWFQGTGVDDHKVVAHGSCQLDQRFRFTNVDCDEYRFEYLEIEFDIAVSEPLIIECWDTSISDWRQIGQKSSSGKSEMYVYNYLTSNTFDVRLRDYDTTNDGVVNSWRVEELCLRMYNHIPRNYKNPICDSLYDGDNIYAMKTPRSGSSYAYITTYHSDGDGYGNIRYCSIAGYNDATMLWEVRYDAETDSYSAWTGLSVVEYEEGTEYKSGDNIDIVWHIKFNWNHLDLQNMIIRVTTQDDGTNMQTNFALGWDVETRLQSILELTDAGDDTRGEVGGLISAEGAVAYLNSLSLVYPPDDAVDIYIIATGITGSPWEALYDNSQFQARYWTWVSADTAVGLDYYRSRVVQEGAGSAGTNLLATDDAVSFIADRIKVFSMSISDARANVNSDVQIQFTLRYEYDNEIVETGDVQINGQDTTYVSNGIWRLTKSQSVVIDETFDTVSIINNEYGIEVVNQNFQEKTVIWDALVVSMTGPTDSRINVGTTATGITASAVYSFDGAAYDGTLTLNSTTYMYGTVGRRGYTVTSASGDSYGISYIAVNDVTLCIWDGLIVSISDPTDSRINVGSAATGIVGSAIYSYDGTVYDGLLTLNSSTFVYESVGKRGYTVISASSDSYGITHILSNDATSCIWDGLIVSLTGPTDSRIDIGDTATGIVPSAIYSYDGASYDGTLSLNSTVFSFDSVGKRGYTVSTASGDTFGITAILLNDVVSCIWDALIVSISDPIDFRINVSDTATGISATAVYSYDGTIFDGTLTLNSTTFTYDSVGMRSYTVISASGDSYGISTILTNDVTSCIWDIVDVVEIGSTSWNQLDESFLVWCRLELRYDNHPLGVGDTVVIADQLAVWNGTHFIVEISFATVGDRTFFVNSTSETTYGITLLGVTESCLVHVTDSPIVESIISEFEAANGLYQGIYSEAPLWIHWDPLNDPTPPSFTFTISGGYIDDWNVTSSWSDLILESGDQNGAFICHLESGLPYSKLNYTYAIFVVNEAGDSTTRFVYITVLDYILPLVDSPEDITMDEGDIGINIVWTCSDIHPYIYEIRVDGVPDSSSAWTDSVIISLDGIEAGTYVYEITIFDTFGNFVRDSVSVIVNEVTTTTTTTTTTSTITTTTTSTITTTSTTTSTTTTGTTTTIVPGGTLTLILVLIFGGVVLIFILLVIFKKR
ncbi:hypothetical protein EU528_12895 [Candidatus Thorarchaeota archaeon]|nr:MAG: hypothetical protein EU528_12895 [Candidatus Thorarchaeota archaeon]